MGCGCKERGAMLSRAASSAKRGNLAAAGRNIAAAGRSFLSDAQSGALRRAASLRLAQMRMPRK